MRPIVSKARMREQLGLNRSEAVRAAELRSATETPQRGSMFGRGGLCSGYELEPLPNQYFIAQEFSARRDDLRGALTTALAEFGMSPVCADDAIWAGHILCKIGALIQTTPFGVYQLSVSQNRNVYLELGIALGLGRPFILVKDDAADVAPLSEGLEYYPISSYMQLQYELGDKVRPYIASIIGYRPSQLPAAGSERTAVIVHGGLDVIDFCVPIAKAIANYNLTPIILGDPTGRLSGYLDRERIPHRILFSAARPQLYETRSVIQAARFGVCRVEKAASPDAFLSLGLFVGLSRPTFLVHLLGHDIPADVRGLSTLAFNSYSDLNRSFPESYGRLIVKYI